MSVTDPLLKDIKGCVKEFLNIINKNGIIGDNNYCFVTFAQILEKIFDFGVIRQQNINYFNRTVDSYAWMISITKSKGDILNFSYRNCVDNVKQSQARNSLAKFRLLIKYCLLKKCLHVPVQFLVENHKTHLYYHKNSIIGDEILSEIFLSVLLQLSKINFSFDLQNMSFLDCGWYVPGIVELELVPCQRLGISVSFVRDQAVIVNIESNSVAAENGNIKIGDVLDKLNGVNITSDTKGRLTSILKNNRYKPVHITVAKAFDNDTKEFFTPIKILLKELKIGEDIIRNQYEENYQDIIQKKESVADKFGFYLRYLGNVSVGDLGSVRQVRKAILCMCENYIDDEEIFCLNSVDKVVHLEIGELGLQLKDKDTEDVIMDHSYMQISSCGHVPKYLYHFAYCVGNKSCDIATRFTCHIFEVDKIEDADTILLSIGQGFHRTHFAV